MTWSWCLVRLGVGGVGRTVFVALILSTPSYMYQLFCWLITLRWHLFISQGLLVVKVNSRSTSGGGLLNESGLVSLLLAIRLIYLVCFSLDVWTAAMLVLFFGRINKKRTHGMPWLFFLYTMFPPSSGVHVLSTRIRFTWHSPYLTLGVISRSPTAPFRKSLSLICMLLKRPEFGCMNSVYMYVP